MTNIHETKKILRQQILNKRTQLSADYYQKANKKITQRILESSAWKEAKTIFMFHSLEYEFDTASLIQSARKHQKHVVLPVSDIKSHQMILCTYPELDDGWQYGSFNIKEPIPTPDNIIDSRTVDLVIVPCVTCTHSGQRLGHGGGFYDRWLTKYSAFSILPYFDELMVSEIPIEKHDQSVNMVITENSIYPSD